MKMVLYYLSHAFDGLIILLSISSSIRIVILYFWRRKTKFNFLYL